MDEELRMFYELLFQTNPDAISAMESPIGPGDAERMRQRLGRQSLRKMSSASDEVTEMAIELIESGELDRMLEEIRTPQSTRRITRVGTETPDFLRGMGRVGRLGQRLATTNPIGLILGVVLEDLLITLGQNPEFMGIVEDSMNRSAARSTQRVGGFRQSPMGG